MPSFFFALVACFLAGFGGRDQRLLAVLSTRLGGGASLLLTGWVAAIATASIAAFAGAGLADLLPPAGKTMLVAIALLLAAIELTWPIRQKLPVEPTRSLFAIFVVLFSKQLGDGARFLIVAVAAATGAPSLAAFGGAMGGGAALTLGWIVGGDLLLRSPLRPVRLVIAPLLLLVALWMGLSARGIL